MNLPYLKLLKSLSDAFNKKFIKKIILNTTMTKIIKKKGNIHKLAKLTKVKLGQWNEVCERSVITDSEIGDYSYIMEDCDIANTIIGKFCSIARNVRINAVIIPHGKLVNIIGPIERSLTSLEKTTRIFFNGEKKML